MKTSYLQNVNSEKNLFFSELAGKLFLTELIVFKTTIKKTYYIISKSGKAFFLPKKCKKNDDHGDALGLLDKIELI